MTRAVLKAAGVLALLFVPLPNGHPQALQEPAPGGDVPSLADPARADAMLTAIQQGLDVIPGEVLIKFSPGTAPAAMQSVMALAPSRGAPAVRWIGDLALLSMDPAAPVGAVAQRLEREPEVEYAQPNHLMTFRAVPNDPGIVRQWNFNVIDVPKAWDINPGGSDIIVAVVDTGVTSATTTISYRLWTGIRFDTVPIAYRMNPDIDASRFAGARDLSSIRLTVPGFTTPPVFDTDTHGTHVAGTILQTTNNNLGETGIAYHARLLSVKSCVSYWDAQLAMSAAGQPGFVRPSFTGGCADTDVIEGVRFAADSGAKMINLSLGGVTESPGMRDAIAYAVSRGAFVAIAMGNGFEQGNPVEYPAVYARAINGAMAVGAVGPSLRRAFYSSTGPHLEIAAPGGDTREGGSAGAVWQVGLAVSDFDPASVVIPRFDRYTELGGQGTSMATPHVVGLAALLYSQGVTSPAAIEAAIKRFARDLGAPGSDPEFGAGLIDARSTLRGLGVAR